MCPPLSKCAVVASISAIIQDELNQLRKDSRSYRLNESTKFVPPRAIAEPDSLVIDSFEWMALASRVMNFFNLSSSGLEEYLLHYKSLGEWASVVQKSREVASQDVTFQTSGSTGSARAISHKFNTLRDEVAYFTDYFGQQHLVVNRIISVVPAHHVYGFLFSVLLPDYSQIPVLRGMKALACLQQGQFEDGDIVIAHPAFLRQFCQRQDSGSKHCRLPLIEREVTFITSTGPCPPAVIKQLLAIGAKCVLEIYGSTETAGIASRVNRQSNALNLPHFELLPRWQRHASSSLIDTKTNQVFDVPDKLVWQNERHFSLAGRLDNAVVVQGKNVFPSRIADVLATHPEVSEARVRLISDDGSQGLKALVVPTHKIEIAQQHAWKQALIAYAAKQLQAIELPTYVTLASRIPINPMGKECDWPLLERMQLEG